MADQNATGSPVRQRLSLDFDWRFHLGDIPQPTPVTHGETYMQGLSKTGGFLGAAAREYDDRSWRTVDVPHDWAVERAPVPEANISHGYLPTGVGWYRKRFDVPREDEGRKLYLEFDGVYRDATVFLNGHRIGNEPSGYISVRYDITDQVLYGEQNVLAVRVDASVNEGWWYEGAGIYRHVWLLKTAGVHIRPWGVFVSSRVDTSRGEAVGPAELAVQTEICNDTDAAVSCRLRTDVLDAAGVVVASDGAECAVPAGDEATLERSLTVERPELWSTRRPYLYRVRSILERDGGVVDEELTSVGLRSAVFDAERGFLLNDVPTMLKGTCNHQDFAGVGVAVADGLQAYRIEQLQEMGSNAWRCAHNPPAPEFLDACDRLGMIVMDETRCMNSTEEGLHQLEAMIRRDRNHPCIVVWSLGNEEHFHQGTQTGKRIIRTMKNRARLLDPSRPVTLAMHHSFDAPAVALLDVMGMNYNPHEYDTFHARFPRHLILATETSPAFCTRGIYEDDPARCHLRAYDVRKTPDSWTHCTTVEEAWKEVDARPFVVGIFPWTGYDYRGEPPPFEWPAVLTNMGVVDLCGFPKDHFYYHQAWWSDRPVLHLFPHWNWPGREGEIIDVWCYSNCVSVELSLNGRSLGRQDMPRNGHLEWKVPYAPGTLRAVGISPDGGSMEKIVETVGAPAQISLTPYRNTLRADGRDATVITVAVRDEAGRAVPYADDELAFSVTGPGSLIGLGNGDPSSHESDKASRRRAFNGLCMAIIQSQRARPGEICVGAATPDGRLGGRTSLRTAAGGLAVDQE